MRFSEGHDPKIFKSQREEFDKKGFIIYLTIAIILVIAIIALFAVNM